MSLSRCPRIPVRIAIASLLAVLFVFPARAEQIKVEGRLIWGTNDEKFNDPKFKPVDAATNEKFRKIFQWKRYFEVNRRTTVVPSRGGGKLEMSKKCVIEITELEGPKVEVTLIGEGNPVNKTVKPLSRGESFTIAGDCKDGSAWFVLITQLGDK